MLIFFFLQTKKYNKQHVLILILVYNLKQVLSISDIQKLLSPITVESENGDKDKDKVNDIDNLYSLFMELEKAELEDFNKSFSKKIEMIKENVSLSDSYDKANSEKTDLILLVLLLVVQANIRKTIAEKLIDSYFEVSESEK